MYFLVYVSAAVTWFSESELRALLTSARFRNEHAGITGMLLYKDGNFMQALEGPEDAVRALYRRIEGDRRHRGLLVLDKMKMMGYATWRMRPRLGKRDLVRLLWRAWRSNREYRVRSLA